MSSPSHRAAGHGARTSRLRDWNEVDFRAAYQCDRFTAMVLGNRLRYIVDHMSTGLMFSAFSPIIRDWYDFAITISGPPDLDYPMPAVSSSLVVFLGTMEDAVRNTIEEYGVSRLKPGDVLVCNDPYRVGTHVNDVCFIRPVFFAGHPIAFVTVRAHQLDMGGIAPGGFSGTKANVYENGLVLGPMLLFEHDAPVRSTLSLVFDNTRFAAVLQPDFMTMFQQLQLGERLLLESIGRYGADAFRGTVRYCCDAAAEAMRDTPFSSGAYRDIDIVIPPGTVLSAMPPDGAIMLYWEVTQALLSGVLRELGKVLGEDAFGGDFGSVAVHNAHGLRADGTAWANVATVGGEHGPWGADKRHDGESYTVPYMVNGLDPATEAMEQDSPVLMLRKEYAVDSGGAGHNRGGAAVIKDSLWLTDTQHYAMPLRFRQPTGHGAHGGHAGRAGAAWLFEAGTPALAGEGRQIGLEDTVYASSTPIAGVLDPVTKAPEPRGRYFYFAREAVWRTRAGAASRYVTNGGAAGATRGPGHPGGCSPTCATAT